MLFGACLVCNDSDFFCLGWALHGVEVTSVVIQLPVNLRFDLKSVIESLSILY